MGVGFKKYLHVERFGTDEVDGIELGTVYVFPKLDGSNGSVWFENGEIKAGSRNRELTLDNDNQGFYKTILDNYSCRLMGYFKQHPSCILYGEWLVPHTLKTYRPDAWHKFYIFDVYDTETQMFLPYDKYKAELEQFSLDFIDPIVKVKNGTEDDFRRYINDGFLIEEGCGVGEGIVLKNYSFINKYGRTTWAKMVRNEFKEKSRRAMPTAETKGKDTVEQLIIDKYVTEMFILKEKSKLGEWSMSKTGELLGRSWYEFIREESWNFIKEFKNPTIDFKKLNRLFIMKVKEVVGI